MTDNSFASIVRSLAEGVDPGRVLRDVANGALTATETSHLLLAAMLEGQLTPLVAIGSPHPVLFDAGQAAFSTGGPARRSVAAPGFGARAGFVCPPAGPGGVEVVAWRGLDRDRLGAASRHPGFSRLIAGPEMAVVAPTDPTVAQLSAGAEFAVSLPLASDGPGALVLLVAEEPDAAGRRALESLRVQVAAGLRAARAAAAG